MKRAEIEKLRQAGLITVEQEAQIVEHFKLKEDGGKFLTVISIIGAVLVACGLSLLIAANWQEIPRGIKIAVGIALMLGAHAGGWYLRERKRYPKSGEALHLGGSCLFLANIALIGQIYNISSRPPNAFLLWWLGIAALPWLLRSKAQLVLTLLAFGVWFGMETNYEASPIYFGSDEAQIVLYATLGLVFLGSGYWLRRSSFPEFAPPTEKLGLLGFTGFFFPLACTELYRGSDMAAQVSGWLFPALAVLGVMLLIVGLRGLKDLQGRWRWVWGLALLTTLAVMAGALYLPGEHRHYDRTEPAYHWLCAIVLFVFCLVQIQCGLHLRSAFMVNLAMAFLTFDIIAVYFNLFGSMTRTGLVFIGGGVFLLVFGILLEKKRRALMRQIKELPA